MANRYIERRNGGYYVTGRRVSLDSIVYAFLRGESPESIVDSFPSLNLEQVYGAITYYLANQKTIDAYLEEEKTQFRRLREESRRKHPRLHAKLDRSRQATPGTSA